MERTWAPDLKPSYTPMTDQQSRIFVFASMCELSGDTNFPPELEQQFLIQVLQKRIEVMKLPINFTPSGKMAVMALVDRPGGVTSLLIDCLNAYEGKSVTAGMLAELYPTGFYDEATFNHYIEDFLKPRKVKWAEIY